MKLLLLVGSLILAELPERPIVRVESGVVSYRVLAKTLGIFTDRIEAANDRVRGEILIEGDSLWGKIVIPVSGFDSGNSRRDRDVARILKGDEYPDIYFEVISVEGGLNSLLKRDRGKMNLLGKLTVGGVEREYSFEVSFRKVGERRYRLRTEIEAKFSHFNIKPPSFGGFIKSTPDQVFLSGDIVVTVIFGEERR
jgi:polyisoprenoid-binding protein YceI